ncbi:MAG: xanthine dehydrogenase small subunit [Ottowia sp.]|uniref:xanthine dehydrogenase small subunit n=1 Tax=Ottowia sp. TaxID=1898956 RepID=UPI0039E4B6B3
MSPSAPPAGPTAPIRFLHRGEIVSVAGEHPTRSVLDWLRESARCTGTKEGCNEGDCGACTVVLGELDAQDRLHLSSVNACIQFLPTLDGKALFTVEDLPRPAADPAALHPVQQALVECHGSQCGFCTPGFVMSLWSSYEQHRQAGTQPTRQQLADELSGNLCRCTGYRPILDAGQRMFDLPAVPLDSAATAQALRELRRERALDYAAPLATPAGPRVDHFHAPATLDELAALRAAKPQARLLAGSTDIGLWVNKQFRDVGDLIYLGGVAELRRIEETAGELRIGAGASLEDAWRALVRRAPALIDVWLRFASLPIRHAGTMGGNVANGSPIGDAPPILMALDAALELRCGNAVRRLPLTDFYLDYMKNALQEGEFVQAIVVPLAAFGRQVRGYKISKRFDCDISALCAGLAIELEGATVRSVRLAYGGMAATVRRAARAEAALAGQPWTQDSVRGAQQALAQDFQPLTDMRASAAYRLQVAQNLLQRLWLETRPDAPLPAAATSVFSAMPHAPA